MKTLTAEERARAFASTKKEEVIRKQRLAVRYHVEDCEVGDRPRRFLQAFAAILKHTNYRFALDHFMRVTAKCARCSAACQLYMATGDDRDIPCYRSELLLSVYRRHFTLGGVLRGRLLGDPGLTDAKVQEMADAFYNCNACRRCTLECPMGIDHALITHLGRYILSELGIIPRNLVLSVREQLTGASGNTSAVPVPALLDSLEFLSEEMQEEKGIEIPFPIDQEGAEYLFLPAVSDYHHGSRHDHGQRRRAPRHRSRVDHRHRLLRRHQLRAVLQRPGDGAGNRQDRGGSAPAEGAQAADRRMRARLAHRQSLLPGIQRGRAGVPAGGQHRRVHV